MEEKIAELTGQIESLRTELHNERTRAAAYTTGKELGASIGGFMAGMVDSGVPEEVAHEVMIKTVLAQLGGNSNGI